MIFLIFVFNLFAVTPITDNCASETCNAIIKVGGVQKFGQSQKDKTELLTWINARKDITTSWGAPGEFTIELTDAASEIAIRYKERLGARARAVSQRVLDLVAGHSMGLSLSTPQINQLKITYSTAKACLQDSQPWCAKAAVAAISIDEPIVTQELLDQIATIFSESGLPGL